jgi:hypothetical protein
MSEADLAKRVLDWLSAQGWDCYPEVTYDFYRADIVAVRGPLLMVVECKTRATVAMWGQAISWRQHAHFICVAHTDRIKPDGYATKVVERHLINYFGIGRILVGRYGITQDPMPQYRRPDKTCCTNLKKKLHPDQKNYTPGTVSGYSTPWRRTMKRAVIFVRDNPGCTIREVIERINHHYSSDASARACVRNWLPLEKGIVMRHIGNVIRYYCRSERS